MSKILIIEDDLILQKLYCDILMQDGYEVIIAANGSEGYNIFQHWQPSILIYDIFCPCTEIYQTVSKIRQQNESIPILLIAESIISENDKILQMVNDIIFKSGDLSEFQSLVHSYLSRPQVLYY